MRGGLALGTDAAAGAAEESGDHPEAAVGRMTWVRRVVARAPAVA